MPLSEIKPTDIRAWQNSLTSYRDENGTAYSPTYLKAIQNQITAIFNYAVKYYNLKENPCHKAGSMGKKNADEMLFWTKEEFNTFIEAVSDKPLSKAIFMTLYYTGIREGELMALTLADIDFEKSTVTINKSYQRLNCEDIITTPNTEKQSCNYNTSAFVQLFKRLYVALLRTSKLRQTFSLYETLFVARMERGCKISGVKKIRVHDIRHSHASLLVEMGFSPLLIAERLGHERVQTTMETYSHLYPNKQIEVANQLDELMAKNITSDVANL